MAPIFQIITALALLATVATVSVGAGSPSDDVHDAGDIEHASDLRVGLHATTSASTTASEGHHSSSVAASGFVTSAITHSDVTRLESGSAPVDDPAESGSARSPDDSLIKMKQDLDGISHVAQDGVMRSYDGEGNVIDAFPMTNAQLITFAKSQPGNDPVERQQLLDAWHDVDGHEVTSFAQMFNPPKHLRPPKQDDDDVEQSINEAVALKGYLESRSSPIDGSYQPCNMYHSDKLFCVGRTCRTHRSCRAFGCTGCYWGYSMHRSYCQVKYDKEGPLELPPDMNEPPTGGWACRWTSPVG
ncbi:hypothetical protein LTR53_005917 [Teratosphaeriaceae sp. CCFEE 6253]|nr:hypothetical protein LTR53_005917 [Teratosphaeriaceae sp. CCFEE 6253]